jgi:crotonobetainyl-CoA:carnitine CoA-transferase CaiB-like acyl-CoA transferase
MGGDTAGMSSTEFLAGVRVVTVAQNLPGPLACARLAEAGARVTKVEPPDGDPFLALSPAWHAEMHKGITVMRLDLKSEPGRARIMALLADTDVFLTSQRPSALARLGLDPETLRTRAPQVRILRIVGSLGDPEQPGHDLTYQAQRGLVGSLTPRTLTADVMTSERAFASVLALLRQPPGSVMDIGLVDCLDPMVASLRHGLTTSHGVLGGGAPRYAVYETKSGRIAVAALEPHFEKNLYEHLGLPRGSDPTAHFQDKTAEEWEKWADERALPIVAVSDLY